MDKGVNGDKNDLHASHRSVPRWAERVVSLTFTDPPIAKFSSLSCCRSTKKSQIRALDRRAKKWSSVMRTHLTNPLSCQPQAPGTPGIFLWRPPKKIATAANLCESELWQHVSRVYRRLAAITAKRDPLEMIARVVPFETLRAEIEAAVLTPVSEMKSTAGCKPIDVMVMFRMLVPL
jgi:hypothetical protein